jgi:hypothetical protein
MKKLVATLSIAAALATSIFAKDNYYIDYRVVGCNAPGNDKVLGIQPLSELVGDGGLRHEIAYGYKINSEVKYGFVGTYMPSEKEWSAGVEASFASRHGFNFAPRLKPYIRSGLSFGAQEKSGSFQISTQIDKITYITADSLNDMNYAGGATWEDKPIFISVILEGGVNYEIVRGLNLNFGFEFQPKYWDIEYRTENDPDILNSLSVTQYYYNLKVGISYQF